MNTQQEISMKTIQYSVQTKIFLRIFEQMPQYSFLQMKIVNNFNLLK